MGFATDWIVKLAVRASGFLKPTRLRVDDKQNRHGPGGFCFFCVFFVWGSSPFVGRNHNVDC